MQFLLTMTSALVAVAATFVVPPFGRSESVLVTAVIRGDTIAVTQFGRVRLLGVDLATPFANAARDRLTALLLHRWVRLESDGLRRIAYVVTGDGVCVNTVL